MHTHMWQTRFVLDIVPTPKYHGTQIPGPSTGDIGQSPNRGTPSVVQNVRKAHNIAYTPRDPQRPEDCAQNMAAHSAQIALILFQNIPLDCVCTNVLHLVRPALAGASWAHHNRYLYRALAGSKPA